MKWVQGGGGGAVFVQGGGGGRVFAGRLCSVRATQAPTIAPPHPTPTTHRAEAATLTQFKSFFNGKKLESQTQASRRSAPPTTPGSIGPPRPPCAAPPPM